jgi:hypothetical protein
MGTDPEDTLLTIQMHTHKVIHSIVICKWKMLETAYMSVWKKNKEDL